MPPAAPEQMARVEEVEESDAVEAQIERTGLGLLGAEVGVEVETELEGVSCPFKNC